MDPSAGKIAGPRSDLVETEVDGNISLYDPLREEVLVLNETASDVWRLCDGEHSLDEIVRLIARAYQIDAEEHREEISKTVGTFLEKRLLGDGSPA